MRGIHVFIGLAAVLCSLPSPVSALYRHNLASLWQNGRVPVCWDSDYDPESGDGKAIRDRVENQWGRAANITFTGWGRCPARNAAAMPDGPPIIFLTRNLADANFPPNSGCKTEAGCAMLGTRGVRPTSVYIPPDSKWFCSLGLLGASRIQCIQAEAVHEFGHALGFAHEHDRPDFPGCLGSSRYPTRQGGGTAVSQYDEPSVMNYCSQNVIGHPGNLGALTHRDVAGLQHVYGLKPAGTFTARGGRCLDVDNFDFKPGNGVQLWDCLNGPNQRWEYDFREGMLQPEFRRDLCLDDASGGTQPGTLADVWFCAHRANSRWDLQRIYIKTLGQKCLYIDKNWNTIMTYCNTTTSMHYSYNTLGMFSRTIDPNLCLEFGGMGSRGKQVTCNVTRLGQRILPNPQGQLTVNGGCLEVADGFPWSVSDNLPVTLQPCNSGKLNQKFKWSGYLKSSGGQCLSSAPTDISRNGVRLQIGSCSQPYVFDFQPGLVATF